MADLITNPFWTESPEWSGLLAEPFEANDTMALHRSLPAYSPTPLVELPALAARLGIGRLLVKNEAERFGLKAFKALGATYAIYQWLARYLRDRQQFCPSASDFYSKSGLVPSRTLTFCSATDGNHGRGVAWVARLLNQRATVFMPRGSAAARIDNIRREGAEVVVVDGTYDDCVRRCAIEAEANGWHVISDTSWPGYEQIPRWIQAGYLTLFLEIEEALAAADQIDLVLVQGGVGALAAAVAWYFRKVWPGRPPILISVEPEQAACLRESIASPEGAPILGSGRQDSIMAGLNCGLPSAVAWPFIKEGFNAFMTIPDEASVAAMRTYYSPVGCDPRIVSGESGAAGLAGLMTLCQTGPMAAAGRSLGLGSESSALLLNTEGDTDPKSFQRLVLDHNQNPTG